VRCTTGAAVVVATDLPEDSPTRLRSVGAELSAQNLVAYRKRGHRADVGWSDADTVTSGFCFAACLATVGAVVPRRRGGVALASRPPTSIGRPSPSWRGHRDSHVHVDSQGCEHSNLKVDWGLDVDRRFETRTPTRANSVTVRHRRQGRSPNGWRRCG
jgi:hypothetical protein